MSEADGPECTDCECYHSCVEQTHEAEQLRAEIERLRREVEAIRDARNLAQDMAKQLLDTLACGRF